MNGEFHWRATALTQALFLGAAAALVAAVASGRWQLIAFGAPLLGVLASIPWQRDAVEADVEAQPDVLRCFEGEDARTVLTVRGTGVVVTVQAPVGMDVDVRPDSAAGSTAVTVRAHRWGRYPLQAHLEVTPRGGLLAATTVVDVAGVFVFPVVPPASTRLPRTALLDRLGTHLTRHTGPGVEFADIRPYVPGDPLRTVNWGVTARRGALFVTERLTDRSLDVAVLVDTSAQPPGAATEATMRSVEGALQVVQSALRAGDRAGLIRLDGQRMRWLPPDLGQRQFYRVLDAVLGAAAGPHDDAGTLAPRAAVPPGSMVVAFSTLLDASVGAALMDLARRGHVVVAVDVLQQCPLPDLDPMLDRMWSLRRSAMYRDLQVVGVEVVPWPDDVGLEHALRALPGSISARGGVR